ncbi:MAG: hypothetical protein ACRC8S_10610 [Fimbriiglobus sp.]
MRSLRIGFLAAALGTLTFSGCMTQQYSPSELPSPDYLKQSQVYFPPSADSSVPDAIPLIGDNGPIPTVLPVQATAGVYAPPMMAIPPQAPATPPKRSFKERVKGLFAGTPKAMENGPTALPPLPMGNSQMTPATLPPATQPLVALDPVVAKAIPVVAPPTAAQIQAVPMEVVQSLQKGAFDPNILPASVLGLPTASPKSNSLEGTMWVRDTATSRVVVRFTADRISAEVEAMGKKLKAQGDYSPGKDGMLHGILTDLDTAEPNFPTADVSGSPFCFRVRVEGDQLWVREPRLGTLVDRNFGSEPGSLASAFVGSYAKTTPEALKKLQPIPPAKLDDDLRQIDGMWRRFWFNEQPSQLNRSYRPGDVERLPAVTVRKSVEKSQQTSLSQALEHVNSWIQEHPAAVQVIATESGRQLGRWIGKRRGNPSAGGSTGAMIGALLGERLTRQKANPSKKPAQDIETIEALAHWLGLEP